ncbi:MAG: 16S rRNA (guanine(966)-N(2))-methyltransferase RsmD [Myxococcota bacterium]
MPRIVGGALGGRRFAAPPGKGTRPTSERVREALASALASRGAFRGRVLDLYAGSGALALEALSRGADEAVLVERDRRVVRQLRTTLQELGLEARAQVLGLDLRARAAVTRVVPLGPFDLVFADPPYALAGELPALLSALEVGLAPGAIVVVEHGPDVTPGPWPPFLALEGAYRYGSTSLAMLRVGSRSPPPP